MKGTGLPSNAEKYWNLVIGSKPSNILTLSAMYGFGISYFIIGLGIGKEYQVPCINTDAFTCPNSEVAFEKKVYCI